MGFLDLFRPKWKHSDADVRAEAVKQLTAEDGRLLAEVVRRDPDSRVRRLALKKIDDPQLLHEVAADDPDEALRRDASEKASMLLLSTAIGGGDVEQAMLALKRIDAERTVAEVARRATHPEVRESALRRVEDAKALAEVARRAEDAEIRLQAVKRVTEPNVLRDIAIHDAVRDVALEAVKRLDDVQGLENVVKKSKVKAIKTAAKEKLDAIKEAERPKDGSLPPEKRRAQLALMCRAVEEAAASDDFQHAEKAFELAKKEIAELGVKKGEENFQKRYDRALLKFQARKQEREAIERAKAAAEAKRQRELEAEKARAVVEQAQSEEDAKLRAIADAAKKEEDERRAVERARRAEEKAKRDAEKAERDKQKEAERQKRDAEAQENVRRYEEAVTRLESLAGDQGAEKKVLEAALKSTDELVKSMGRLPKEAAPLRDRHQAARGKLVVRLQELRESEDWKRWANVPRLEGLVGKMEALLTAATAEGADLKAAATELKALQTEWKSVGPAPKEKSEALWKKFKAAADAVYERVKAQRTVADEERQANLKKKEELCARVEALAETPDEQMQWKETAETIKTLQDEWKGTGPVPKDASDAVWKRFRGACDKFFERRKAHFGELDQERTANLQRYESLIARAEQLSSIPDEKMNWKETAEQLKSLQADWKSVGPAPKDQSEAIWQKFRGACDRFFERRKQHFDQLDEERQGNLKKKELLCEKVEALKDADDHEAAMAEVKKLQAEWKTVGPAPKEQADAIWARFRTACDVVFDRGRNPEPAAAAAGGETPAPTGKFEHKAFAGIAEKLQQAAAPSVQPETPSAAPLVQPPTPTAAPAAPSEQAEKLQEAASGWEDIAATVENESKKPD